jgi:hypothetical protein
MVDVFLPASCAMANRQCARRVSQTRRRRERGPACVWLCIPGSASPSVYHRPQQVSITGAVACGEDRLRTGAFIHTQVAVVVILHERQAVLGQRLLEATEMRRLVVGNGSGEVENHGADHGLASLVRLVKPL